MYLSHVVFHISLSEVATAFGRDRSTAAHAFHRIEEMREDPELDRTLGGRGDVAPDGEAAMSAPTQSELEREARRLFRKMVSGARLMRVESGDFALVARARKAEHAKTRVHARDRRGDARPRLARRDDDGFALSDAGLGWYRRDLAPPTRSPPSIRNASAAC